MEIGKQIKSLRLRRGITQEALAEALGVTAQAVSKWERDAAAPDIGLLPELSAYFGVTIDELFALSDDTRMERIQNMLWDVRFLEQTDVEAAREFLLEMGRREPENGRPYELLADMENHLARGHRDMAAEYAKEAMRRDPDLREVHAELVEAMGGKSGDWCYSNHHALISCYQDYIAAHPNCWRAYMVLMDQLIDDFRTEEAAQWCDWFAAINNSWRVPLYRGLIAWQNGAREEAFSIWARMERDFPDVWQVYHNIGDHLLRVRRYDEAETYYRRALEVQEVPRYVDPIESIAQLRQTRGDYVGAVEALEEELDIFDREWHFTTGETADAVRREIIRLREKTRQGHICRPDNQPN